MENQATYDDAIDGVDNANDVELQDRMAGDDQPWQSESDGNFYDNDGNVIYNEVTGKPITSIDEVNSGNVKEQAQQPKPTKPVAQVNPFEKSFDAYAFGDNGVTPELLNDFAKIGSDYSYADDMVLKIDEQPGAVEKVKNEDPIEVLRSQRAQWEDIAIKPINSIREALISNGAPPAIVEEILHPILDKQTKMVNSVYQEQFEKTIYDNATKTSGEKVGEIEKRERSFNSMKNVDELSRKYYPKGGKDQFFALINGHSEGEGDKKTFVRGPASIIIDMLTSVSNDGKKFGGEEERLNAYKDTFTKLTADPAKAKALFDMVHYYYLGKKFKDSSANVFKQGKDAAAREAQRIQKTVKTQPTSYSPAVQGVPLDGMPQFMRDIMAR